MASHYRPPQCPAAPHKAWTDRQSWAARPHIQSPVLAAFKRQPAWAVHIGKCRRLRWMAVEAELLLRSRTAVSAVMDWCCTKMAVVYIIVAICRCLIQEIHRKKNLQNLKSKISNISYFTFNYLYLITVCRAFIQNGTGSWGLTSIYISTSIGS